MSTPLRNQPEVLHETESWLVVSKPSGWHSVLRAGGARDWGDEEAQPVLEEWLARAIQGQSELPEAGLVHRLDYLTSGCMLVARSAEAMERLQAMVQGRRPGLLKVYLAMAGGNIEAGSFDYYFRSRHRRSRKVTVWQRGEESERGRCRWIVRERMADHTLLEVEIFGPGRRHQIRAGLAHLGHPLRGDALYGGAEWEGRFGLHAWRLDMEGARIIAPPPEPWRAPIE